MKIKRRTFLQISAFGGAQAVLGCSSDVDKILFPLVESPDDLVVGKSLHYASTCRECPAGCGVLVKTREGRAVKIEGNPLHPVNRGKICMRGQAVVQGVYHPDRLKRPLLKENGRFREVGLDEALASLRERTQAAADRGSDRVRMLTDLPGESLWELFKSATGHWNSAPPVIFEPFACHALKEASRMLFGRPVLPDYALHQSDLLISFGADFLETWISPVSYAQRFKEMHAYSTGREGRFFHVSPYQSLTAANADRWICCRPGSEHHVALWVIHELIEDGKGGGIPAEVLAWLAPVVSACTRNAVSEKTGIEPAALDGLLSAIKASKTPLVLGSGGLSGGGDLPVDLSALLLNFAMDPSLALLDFNGSHRLAEAAGREGCNAFFEGMTSGAADVLILHRVNPVYSLPNAAAVRDTLENDDLFVVSFADILDDTAQLSDLVIPICHPLESWDEFASRRGSVSLLQPAMAPPKDVLQAGDVILQTAFGEDRPATDYNSFVAEHLFRCGLAEGEVDWLRAVQRGGFFGQAISVQDNATSGAEPIRRCGNFRQNRIRYPGESGPYFFG